MSSARTLSLTGTVDLSTVPALERGTDIKAFDVIDWSGVSKVDSSALALAMAWQGRKPELTQKNQPAALKALAQVYDAA